MAESKPDSNRPSDANPRVVPLGSPRPQPGRSEREGDVVSWNTFAIAVALLVFAAAALIVQTQRVANRNEQIGALTGQVQGLEAQLTAANAQLATYHLQLGRIRSSVSAVVDEVSNLNALVQVNPFSEPAAPTPPADLPAAD
jgi:hypothetical protein